MESDTRPSSPVLPGGWSSAWSVPALKWDALNASALPKLPGDSLRLEQIVYFDPPRQPAPQMGRRVSMACSVSACSSDGESTNSDDFYSTTSHQDGDLTLPRDKETLQYEDGIVVALSAEQEAHPPKLSLKLKGLSQPGVPLPYDVPSEASASCGIHMPEHPHLASDMSNVSSICSVQAGFSSSDFERGASSSRRSSSSCSSRSVVFRKNVPDQDSLHSLHSDYTHFDKNYTMSSESVPRPHNPTSYTNPRSIHRRPINAANNSNFFGFSQPSGDDPWTLSLEPALTSTESSTSRSSFSLSSELSDTSPQNSEILERYLTSITSSLPFNPIPHRSSTNSHQGNAFYDIHTGMTTQRSNNTIDTALPQQETFFSYTDFGYPPHTQGQPKSNNVIKKTKFLYSKFKNLIVSRGSKRTQVLPDEKQDPQDPVVPIHSKFLGDASDEDTGTPPAVNTLFSPSSSRTSWTFRKFHRSTQMSAPSTAHSSTTEVARNHPSASMDGIHPYGYQAMPRTSKEIRSGRRFSMPTFAGQASGSNASVPQSLGTFNSRPYRRQQASSIISTH